MGLPDFLLVFVPPPPPFLITSQGRAPRKHRLTRKAVLLFQIHSSDWFHRGFVLVMVCHLLLALLEPSSTVSEPLGARTMTWQPYRSVVWVEFGFCMVYLCEVWMRATFMGVHSFVSTSRSNRVCVLMALLVGGLCVCVCVVCVECIALLGTCLVIHSSCVMLRHVLLIVCGDTQALGGVACDVGGCGRHLVRLASISVQSCLPSLVTGVRGVRRLTSVGCCVQCCARRGNTFSKKQCDVWWTGLHSDPPAVCDVLCLPALALGLCVQVCHANRHASPQCCRQDAPLCGGYCAFRVHPDRCIWRHWCPGSIGTMQLHLTLFTDHQFCLACIMVCVCVCVCAHGLCITVVRGSVCGR